MTLATPQNYRFTRDEYYRMADVGLLVADDHESYEWNAPVWFCEPWRPAFGLLGQKSMPYGLNRSKFWEHSIATAVAGGVVARVRLPKARSAPDEAFVGGLLHDLGALFLDCYFPVQYAVAMAYAAREKKTSREAENMVLGLDHVMVGRRIAEFAATISPTTVPSDDASNTRP